MLRRFSLSFALLSILLDAILIVASLQAAVIIRPNLNQFSFIAYLPAPIQLPGLAYAMAVVVWGSVFLLLGLYDGRKNYRVVDELSLLIAGSILAAVSLAGVLYLSYREISRALYLVFVALASFSLISWRLAARAVFRYQASQAVTMRRVLIVGDGPLAQAVGEQVRAYANLGWVLAGYLSDVRALGPELTVLGQVRQARRIVQDNKIDDVLIAQPLGTHETTNRLVAELYDLPVKIWAVPDYFSLSLQRARYQNFAGLAMLDLDRPSLTEYQRLVKRGIDLLLGGILLIPASVLMALIGLAIRLESPGEVIFKQARIGENGRLFFMYKFRTMVAGAEEMREMVEATDAQGNLIHKRPDDPRVTRVGRLLRRTSLDELPQLINVLRGEMSLVGPRPELPYLVERYEPWQRQRLSVPQGLTGWWQVNGRSDRPMHLHTEDDLYYIQNYSLALDLKILLMTVVAVLRGRGAF